MFDRRLHNLYHNMMNRCYNPKNDHFKFYGARGITVCDLWKNNKNNFINWCINNGQAVNLQIDRIDVNGNYNPNNCRFVDSKTNSRNRTSNRCNYEKLELIKIFIVNGLSNKDISQLFDVSQRTVSHIKNNTQWI
jgi:predicted DNA-binding protein (UPF0251 family)